jgi:hypothetical protein
VKQSDLGGYEENAREKAKKTNMPKLKRAITKTQGFSMAKDYTPPEIKSNSNKDANSP